jgi:hypothetical protein
MKSIFCCLVSLFLLQPTHAQIAFHDAQKLKDAGVGTVVDDSLGYLVIPSNPALYPLLKLYAPGAATESAILTAFDKNPFLRIVGHPLGNRTVTPRAALTTGKQVLISGLGALPVTNIANGIAQFMIKRAKEELTITFFNKFQEFAQKHQEFMILFPKTVDILGKLLSFQYPTMLSHLQNAFLEDLSNLYVHLPAFLALPQFQALFDRFPEIKVAIGTLELVQKFANSNTSPADILLQYEAIANPGGARSQGLQDFGNAVSLAAIFSESVREDSANLNDRSWITLSTFKAKASDPIYLQIYLGLVYQKIVEKDIRFGTKHFANEFAKINNPSGPLALMREEMSQFLFLAQKTDSLVRDLNIKKAAGIALTNDDIFNYINTGIDVVEFSFDIGRFFTKEVDVHNYTKLARDGNSIYRNIYKMEYPEAVTHSVDFVQEIFTLIQGNSNEQASIITDIKTALNVGQTVITADSLDDLGAKQYDAISNAINTHALTDNQRKSLRAALQYRSIKGVQKTLDIIKNYGLFMANLSTAKTADEVESIIENAALPVGSSSIKKYSKWNISVQSYLGASFRIDNPPASQTAWNNRVNVAGPIGISINRGLGKGGSIGGMFTLLDLGAIIDYQLKQEVFVDENGKNGIGIKKDYEVRLGQIFSPGFHVVYGFWHNLPLAAGIGIQYGPGLGKIDNGGNALINNPNLRFNAFLAVDIPFFTLYNKKFNTY